LSPERNGELTLLRDRIVLITGGAGFIGSNLAGRLLGQSGVSVRVFDNFSRSGVEHNIRWLKSLSPAGRLEIICGDVRNASQLAAAVSGATEIYHLAAQVAVTTSVDDPRTDFDVNALGTLNVLEAARRSGQRPMVLFTSTNKVYGALDSVPVQAGATAYAAVDPAFKGVTEKMPLDFHSPYGCSKGAADQYVRDYARIYNLPTVVFRMSCIAGPRQFGNEDQGWVAHFLYSVLSGHRINIYGNGLQVRDILHVDDLLDAMQAVRTHLPTTQGEIFNLGGGTQRAVSILELLRRIERLTGESFDAIYGDVRPGDQPLYITDTAKLNAFTGWRPRRSLKEILADIYAFWKENCMLIEERSRMSAEPVLRRGVA
jgi:CDP-paratose 2-epimerase